MNWSNYENFEDENFDISKSTNFDYSDSSRSSSPEFIEEPSGELYLEPSPEPEKIPENIPERNPETKPSVKPEIKLDPKPEFKPNPKTVKIIPIPDDKPVIYNWINESKREVCLDGPLASDDELKKWLEANKWTNFGKILEILREEKLLDTMSWVGGSSSKGFNMKKFTLKVNLHFKSFFERKLLK